MKKLLVGLLTFVLMIFCFVSCSSKEIKRQDGENYTIFTFDNFEGNKTLKMNRTGLGEGAIYYYADLSEGTVKVKYRESVIFGVQDLLTLYAGMDVPEDNSVGYIEGDEIDIIFEASSPVSGEIIIAFVPEALTAIHKDSLLHKHTYEWVVDEETHRRVYTCQCGLPADEEAHHYDDDGDLRCDLCDADFATSTYLRYTVPWFSSLNSENVVEIKTTYSSSLIHSGAFSEIHRTTDKDVISDFLAEYDKVKLIDPGMMEFDITDAFFQIDFVLSDGRSLPLLIWGDLLCEGQYLISEIPRLDSYENITTTYRFNSWCRMGVVRDSYVFVDLTTFEFAQSEYRYENEPYYYIDTEKGTISVYSETHFEFNGIFYKILDANLFEMITTE